MTCSINGLQFGMHLTQLTELKLKSCNIEELNALTLKGLHNLESLDLGYNHFKHLDSDWFSDLKKLKVLDLNHNIHLEYIHPEF